MATEPIWYHGVCDQLLGKIADWYGNYHRGEVCKDADYMTMGGEVVKKPTMYAHRVPLTINEIAHLERIMNLIHPKDPLTVEVHKIRNIWKRGRLLPGNMRMLTLSFYQVHVKQMLDALLRARANQLKSTQEVLEEQKKAGKDLFEV